MKKLIAIATIFITLTVQSGTLTHYYHFVQPIAEIIDNSTLDEDSTDGIISNTLVHPDNSVSSVSIYESGPTDDLAFYSKHNLDNGNLSQFDQFGFPINFAGSPGASFTYISDLYTVQPNQTYNFDFTANIDNNGSSTPIYYLDLWVDGVNIADSGGTPFIETDLPRFGLTENSTARSGLLFSTTDITEVQFAITGSNLNHGLVDLTTTFRISNVNDDTDYSELLQNQTIPEPSTIAFLGIGLGVLAIRSRWIKH